jgi:RsiW-degrading membrane proteinase PrsW (M82 family)
MPPEKNKLPSVLLLMLSTLGILIGLLTAAATLWAGSNNPSPDSVTFLSISALSLLTGLLNTPAFVLALKDLSGKDISYKQPLLFKHASFALAVWACLLAAGMLLSRSGDSQPVLAPITILAVAIPIWWLVEFGRRGLARSSALREWGTITMGLTISPLIIMIIEVIVVVLAMVFVFIVLSFQPGLINQITAITESLQLSQGGLEELENQLYQLMQSPLITAAIFSVIGLIAPLIEELFKPLAVWLLLGRSIKPRDGFTLGLISGGMFALLESAGLISQVGSQEWISAIALRAATDLLHIGLSGMVGFGIASAWSENRKGRVFLYVLSAGLLHGLWNSAALLSGYVPAVFPNTENGSFFSPSNLISLIVMIAVFAAVLWVILRINHRLVHEQNLAAEQPEEI